MDALRSYLDDYGTRSVCHHCEGDAVASGRTVWCIRGKHVVAEADCPLDSCSQHLPLTAGARVAVPHSLSREPIRPNILSQPVPDLDLNPCGPALHQADTLRVDAFNHSVKQMTGGFTVCTECRERYFEDKTGTNSMCPECRNFQYDIRRFSEANAMQPKLALNKLPALSLLEEMMLAACHGHCALLVTQSGQSRGKITLQMLDQARMNAKVPLPVEDCPVVAVAH